MQINQIKIGSLNSTQYAVGKILSIVFCLLLTLSSFAQKAVPELWGIRVHDDAHALKQETVDQLEKDLKAYEDSTSNQIAILIVQSLDGDVLEEYSLRVAEKWKLGTKNKDNGALLLIAVDDHKMRIEVGQGLEGVLTDAQSNRIIRNKIAPEFRRGDYDAGVKAGINAIMKAIAGEYSNEASPSNNTTWIVITILAILFFIIILIVAFVKEFRSGENQQATKNPFKKKSKKSDRGSSGKGFWGGMSSGGSSGGSSWSSGGSSFSGGGGSFGGGGSSGGW
jgi:uncharacterized protein